MPGKITVDFVGQEFNLNLEIEPDSPKMDFIFGQLAIRAFEHALSNPAVHLLGALNVSGATLATSAGQMEAPDFLGAMLMAHDAMKEVQE